MNSKILDLIGRSSNFKTGGQSHCGRILGVWALFFLDGDQNSEMLTQIIFGLHSVTWYQVWLGALCKNVSWYVSCCEVAGDTHA